MNLEKMAEKYRDAGYSERNADARVCQDIVLKAIARSNLGRNVTIKGGVVMRSITGNVRRATEDLDLDFIKYSLEDESIRYFISKLNCLEGIRIEIKGNKIEQLSQQEYSGKRVYIIIKDDEGNVIESKIDLGVHANMNIEQDTYCFDVCMDDKERQSHDYYATEPKARELLLAEETFAPVIWECACGEGHMAKVLEEYGCQVISTDLIYRGYGNKEPVDFLHEPVADFDGDIITNPPYKYALQFVDQRHFGTFYRNSPPC